MASEPVKHLVDEIMLQDRASAIIVPPSGTLGIQNIGGNLMKVNPDGTVSALGGSSSASGMILPAAAVVGEVGDSIMLGYNDMAGVHADTTYRMLAFLERYLTEAFQCRNLAVPTYFNTAVTGQTTPQLDADFTNQIGTPMVAQAWTDMFICIGANDPVTGPVTPTQSGAAMTSIITKTRAIRPNMRIRVILWPFCQSEVPTSANNVALRLTNNAIAAAALAFTNVEVYDLMQNNWEWERRNNPSFIYTNGMLTQGGTHPSKPWGLSQVADFLWNNMSLPFATRTMTASEGVQGINMNTMAGKIGWIEALQIAQFTGGLENLPGIYSFRASGGGLSANDASNEGGALAGSPAIWFSDVVQFTAPNTSAWGVRFRAKWDAQAAGTIAECGILSPTASHLVRLRSDQALGATLRLDLNAGALTRLDTGYNPGTAWHDVGIYFTGSVPSSNFSGSAVYAVVDGVVIAQQGTLTNIPTNACAPYSSDSGGAQKMRIAENCSFFLRP